MTNEKRPAEADRRKGGDLMNEKLKGFLSKDNPSDEEVRNAAEQLIYISAGLRFGAMDLLDSARDQLLLAYVSIAERSGDLLSESSESLQDIQDEVIKQIGLLEYLCKQEGENVAESFKKQRNHLYRTKKYARQLKEASEQKN